MRKICFYLNCVSGETSYKYKIYQNFNRNIFETTNFFHDKTRYAQTLLINVVYLGNQDNFVQLLFLLTLPAQNEKNRSIIK